MKLRINGINLGLTFAILTLLLTTQGCSSGGSSSTALTGVFLDSPVSGLEYETDTFQGVTGSGGAFSYNRGETIRFFVGDTTLCETPAASIVTPIDCVEGATDETHPMVTNMLVFLQSIDFDNDPENGIDITELMQQKARGMRLDFDRDPAAFMEDYDFRNYLERLNSQEMSPNFEDRIPPSIEQARQHMQETMIEHGLYGYGPGMQNMSNNLP